MKEYELGGRLGHVHDVCFHETVSWQTVAACDSLIMLLLQVDLQQRVCWNRYLSDVFRRNTTRLMLLFMLWKHRRSICKPRCTATTTVWLFFVAQRAIWPSWRNYIGLGPVVVVPLPIATSIEPVLLLLYNNIYLLLYAEIVEKYGDTPTQNSVWEGLYSVVG